MNKQSLKDKAVQGTFWSATDAFLGQGVTFLVGIVLARILSPEEYGLIGIVTIFTTIMHGIVDCGFSNSLIRKQKVNDDDYTTLFTFNLVVSLAMYGLLFVGAPWIAVFFKRPQSKYFRFCGPTVSITPTELCDCCIKVHICLLHKYFKMRVLCDL